MPASQGQGFWGSVCAAQKAPKKDAPLSLCILSGELAGKNFGRELVFSADLCYNGANEKPPLCKGRWQPKADGGIVKKAQIAGNNPSVANATAPFTQGSLCLCSFIFRGMGFARCLCNTKAKLAIKRRRTIVKSFFELKTKMPYDLDVLEDMKATAFDLLCNTNKEKYTQAVVLYSATGNKYNEIIKNACSEDMTEEKELIEKLKAAGDTEIRYVLCMWQDNNVDIPSIAFRKMLCELDQKNQEAVLFVMTTEDISATKMSVTMK